MDADVIVVGAGAAGLAAACRLAERSVHVIVLEGRDGAGGRVKWQSVGTVDVPAELGAEFIHGDALETSALLHDAGRAKVATGGAAWFCSPDGGNLREDDDAFSGAIFERVSLLSEDESVAAFLGRFEDDRAMHERVSGARTFVEGFEAADPSRASVRSIAEELRMGTDSTSFRPVGSYAPAFEHLIRRCERAGVDLRLGTAVERITWKRGDVSIAARKHAGEAFTLQSRCAIVTVPVGVLQQCDGAAPLSFEPPLPPEKKAAIHGLEMGHAVRVTLAFRTPFWEEIAEGRYRDAAFFRCDDGTFNAFWTQMPLRSRTIVAWAGGPRATAMNDMAAKERVELALDEFAAMLGQRERARHEYEDGVTHDWSADPFACGVYSYVATGAGTARSVLGSPVDDTLFFAGEATSTDGQGGTVSGALGTGMRAADEVAHSLGIAPASRRAL